MNFKYLFFILLLFVLSSVSYSADRWNVLMAGLDDLSAKKDKSIGMTIQKSIAGQFRRENGFNYLSSTNAKVSIENFQDALNIGRTYKADAVIFGDYYVEGEELVVSVQVYDVLENRLKMRKSYTGAVGLDIFDTIDAMASDIVAKIKEVLPEMTGENEVRIKQIRQNIYETEKVNIKRMFYTRLGFFTECGPKYLRTYSSFSNSYIEQPGNEKWWATSEIPIGFTVRIWDIRADFMMSGLPGVPAFDWSHLAYSHDQIYGNISFFSLSYYLPWFNHAWAVGLGTIIIDRLKDANINQYDPNKYNYDRISDNNFSMSFNIIWNPSDSWEFSFMIVPFFSYLSTNQDMNPTTQTLNGWDVSQMDIHIPLISIGMIYFLGNFGFEFRAAVDDFTYTYTFYDTNKQFVHYNNFVKSTTVGLYLGFVYRVDFLK